MKLDPNEMTDPGIVKSPERVKFERKEKKSLSKAQSNAVKSAYKRLVENDDFKIFYKYLETCYNSYMDQSGAIELPKDQRDFISNQANAYYKVLTHIQRQAS